MGRFSPQEVVDFQLHLAECKSCHKRLRLMRSMESTIGENESRGRKRRGRTDWGGVKRFDGRALKRVVVVAVVVILVLFALFFDYGWFQGSDPQEMSPELYFEESGAGLGVVERVKSDVCDK